MVESRGFQLGNVTNTESASGMSAVMFKPNNGRAAQKVAKSLDIPRVQPMTEEVAQLGEARRSRSWSARTMPRRPASATS